MSAKVSRVVNLAHFFSSYKKLFVASSLLLLANVAFADYLYYYQDDVDGDGVAYGSIFETTGYGGVPPGFIFIGGCPFAGDGPPTCPPPVGENDNCPTVYNPDQKDTDGNGVGDACDTGIAANGLSYSFDYSNSLDPNTLCASGQYWVGAVCTAASPGYYVPSEPATSETACAAGSYQPNSGQTSCMVVTAPFVKDDYDGDGKSDVLFLNSTTGGTQYWKSATKAQSIYPGTYDNVNYVYAGSGDFNGDGKTDLLFTRASNNGTLIWSGAVKATASYPGTSIAGFTVAAICDTTGDGKDDIVWFNATTGGMQIWPAATKANVIYPGTQNTAYTLAACGDFDGDGKADLFWRNATTGADEIWNGGSKASKAYPGAYTDLTWNVIGAGDIDADGKSDVIWYQGTTGATQVWHSGLKSAATYPGTNATTFTPKAIGDYDGDGKADLLWGNDTTFGTQIWSGVVKSAVTYPGTYPSGFSIQK